ncbi:helix-turn-helix domain-containing protein [Kiritimatiellaeota bacterium B1221]|nr:helix-turn-helix domain-containing protein [Kiritimatiellaeota bacterium B1221]
MSSNQRIPILNRTLQVLEALTQRGQASAKQLSIDLDIPPATCYRILNTLADANWLLRDEVGDYRLSFGISRLGGLASDMARFFAISNQPIADLADQIDCSVKISIREGDDWLILARHERTKPKTILNKVGIRDCVAIGSAGAVLLRNTSDVEILRIIKERPSIPKEQIPVIQTRIDSCRKNNFATDLGETNPEIHAVSVPVCLSPLEENASLTAVFSAQDRIKNQMDGVIAHLQNTAEAIEQGRS